MNYGKLYGVGVGPGASDLMTLRAVRVLNTVDVLVIPRPNPYAESLAWRIAKPNVENNPNQERIFATFPMTKDPAELAPAWDFCLGAMRERLEKGKDVAFLTQGDPMVYSTFIYMYEAVLETMPGVKVEIVPGVTSLSAVPGAAGVPLADGQERIAIIPATYGTDDLRKVLREFDSVILMKVSSKIPEVIAALEAEGLLDRAVYVERATSADQRVVTDLRTLATDKCSYFSTIVINKKVRSGILRHGSNEAKLCV